MRYRIIAFIIRTGLVLSFLVGYAYLVGCTTTTQPSPAPQQVTKLDERFPTQETGQPTPIRQPTPMTPAIQATMVTARRIEAPKQEQEIFATYCIACHGKKGEGTSVGVPLNTTDVQRKDRELLSHTIQAGVVGTAMPGWGAVLKPEEIANLVSFIQQQLASSASATPIPPVLSPPIDPGDKKAMANLGAQLYQRTCASCHGEDGIGGIGPAINSQQFLTRHNDELIRDAIINGGWRPASRMPAFGSHMTRQEIEALVQYLRSWEPTAPFVDDPRGTDQIARGIGQGMGQGPGQGMGRGQGQGQGQGMGQGPGQGMGRGQGMGMGRGQGQGQGQGMGQGQGQQGMGMIARNATPVTYHAELVDVRGSLLSFRTREGEVIEAMLGPLWYWYEHKIPLEPGDPILVEGFSIPEYYVVVSKVVNERSGESYQARTAEGFPLWSQGQNP